MILWKPNQFKFWTKIVFLSPDELTVVKWKKVIYYKKVEGWSPPAPLPPPPTASAAYSLGVCNIEILNTLWQRETVNESAIFHETQWSLSFLPCPVEQNGCFSHWSVLTIGSPSRLNVFFIISCWICFHPFLLLFLLGCPPITGALFTKTLSSVGFWMISTLIPRSCPLPFLFKAFPLMRCLWS